ncbi:MAG: hypothetical protein KDB71_04755 [Mycobacterium sp.]|nr:hypothetical protein [Mycobacterium sp.]
MTAAATDATGATMLGVVLVAANADADGADGAVDGVTETADIGVSTTRVGATTWAAILAKFARRDAALGTSGLRVRADRWAG